MFDITKVRNYCDVQHKIVYARAKINQEQLVVTFSRTRCRFLCRNDLYLIAGVSTLNSDGFYFSYYNEKENNSY